MRLQRPEVEDGSEWGAFIGIQQAAKQRDWLGAEEGHGERLRHRQGCHSSRMGQGAPGHDEIPRFSPSAPNVRVARAGVGLVRPHPANGS